MKPEFLSRRSAALGLLASSLMLAGCQFQPLYGNQNDPDSAQLSDVTVGLVNTRVGQQVRNHLLFLLNGGRAPLNSSYRADLRVTSVNKTLASSQAVQDRTAGQVVLTVSYDLVGPDSKPVASGSRVATASYDRTTQSFANSRALRDAENRAAKEVAELLRLAIASDLRR